MIFLRARNPALTRAIFPSSVFSYSSGVGISPAELQALVLRQYGGGGKFCNLLSSVVSRPSVLLAACSNINRGDYEDDELPTAITRYGISVEQLSRELRRGEFDLESCCVKIAPSRVRGESLVLPNLKLKVVIEAISITLEAIYESRFCTFAYGARKGIGRHTAVRYLKSAVRNPSWWFRVSFCRQVFESRHLSRLISFIEEKIEDPSLIDLIRRLFVSEALQIEFGGNNAGKGFPQETGFSLLLLNIYFNGLDRDLRELRLEVRQQYPRIAIFHNPVRLYVVRYLDEILMISSGSKMLAMEAKERVVKFLEENLDLKVNKSETAVHCAVSEKINFLGMEIQAVPPSVLRPPLSEKAVRARKKYLKQKAAKVQELENARETRRKKLGLKILSHVIKKLRKSGEFQFEFKIKSEVRQVFSDWAREVVQKFFQSKEELRVWHRTLRSGDFLNLKQVRDLLPGDLIESYDRFQWKINEYLHPEKSSILSNSRDQIREEEEKEEAKYAERTVEDLTRVCVRVCAPAEAIRKAVVTAGITNRRGRPRAIKLLFALDDADIVKWYAGVGIGWLEFFCCCRNFRLVKTIVDYHLRFSCILTLAGKHESTKREAIKHYTRDLRVRNRDGEDEVIFPTEREIRTMGDQNLADPRPPDGALGSILVKLADCETGRACAAHFCGGEGVQLYRVRLLQNRLNVDPLKEKWVRGMGAVHESLNKKCLALCTKHAGDLYLGRICLQHVDCTSFVNI